MYVDRAYMQILQPRIPEHISGLRKNFPKVMGIDFSRFKMLSDNDVRSLQESKLKITELQLGHFSGKHAARITEPKITDEVSLYRQFCMRASPLTQKLSN